MNATVIDVQCTCMCYCSVALNEDTDSSKMFEDKTNGTL